MNMKCPHCESKEIYLAKYECVGLYLEDSFVDAKLTYCCLNCEKDFNKTLEADLKNIELLD